MSQFVSIRELEELARARMNANAFEYYRSGANEEITKAENITAFSRIPLNPRVLIDVSKVSLKTKILGHEISMPFGIAPAAMQKLCHPKGECIAVSVTEQVNIPYTLSTLSTSTFEDVAAANKNGLRFFQLYIQKDRKLTEALVKRAELNGFKALIVTVDAPVLGKREADERQKFVLPSNLKMELLASMDPNLIKVENSSGSGLMKFFKDQLDQTLSWKDIAWLKSITKLPIVLKGIQCKEDALLAKHCGADAIWVTNHGGRQLDTVRATIDILPEVVQAVGPDYEVYVDGGVRSGTDIYKCLALGARCVFFARPMLYSMAIAGEEGVKRMIEIFRSELETTMQLMGVTSISEITPKGIIQRPRL